MRIAGKVWGETALIHANGALEFHRIEARANTRCSKHMHRFKWNGFFVEAGHLVVRVWQQDYDLCDVTHLKPGDFMQVKPGLYHSFEALADTIAFELYWAEFNHDDIVREDVGGQTNVVPSKRLREQVGAAIKPGQPTRFGKVQERPKLDGENSDAILVCGQPGCTNYTGLTKLPNGMVRCPFHLDDETKSEIEKFIDGGQLFESSKADAAKLNARMNDREGDCVTEFADGSVYNGDGEMIRAPDDKFNLCSVGGCFNVATRWNDKQEPFCDDHKRCCHD